MKPTLLISIAIAFSSSFAFAGTQERLAKVESDYQACLNSPDGQSNAGMKGCTGEAYEAADQVLNDVYTGIVKGLKSKTGDKYADEGNAETLKRLVAAERAWITYRDSNSDLYGTTMLGGSGESLEIASKAYEMTKDRAQELSNLLGN